ncbi:MAG: ROK family protein [Clostridia bacterium]|nr:ROK family protein [Clostridia bacterium]
MYRIGFDIGGTNLVCGLMDADFNLIKKAGTPFRRRDNDPAGEGIAEDLYSLASSVCASCGVDFRDVPSVGVCIPGSVDTARGIVIDAHNLGLHDAPFRETVSRRFGKPAEMLNDADAAALAEQRIGALAGTENSMLVTIGTGIGVGIILGGQLFHGGRGYGVEAGHAQMDVNGESCTCGRRGCIETLCAATWLNRRAAELFEKAEGTVLELYKNVSDRGKFDAKALITAARMGERASLAVWDRYIDNLSNALGSYINILDPQLIAIGGGVSGAGEFLLAPLNERTAKQSFFREPTPIVRAKLGNDAGLVGAAMYGNI